MPTPQELIDLGLRHEKNGELELVKPSDRLVEDLLISCTHPATRAGDPEHGSTTRHEIEKFLAVNPDGRIMATENGCFAKTFGLNPNDEPTSETGGSHTASISSAASRAKTSTGHGMSGKITPSRSLFPCASGSKISDVAYTARSSAR